MMDFFRPKQKVPDNQPRVLQVNQNALHPGCAGNYVSTTKYNPFTYFPKALYEQFRRVANVYFTAVAALSTTSLSPVAPVTTFTPLVLVLGVSMGKEALEDLRRYQADVEVNKRAMEVYDPASKAFVTRQWRDIKVGEVVRIKKDTFFPADLLLLSSTNPDGICYIETINLDGESNLKIKKALDQTKSLDEQSLGNFSGELHCEQPNASLYTFTGNLKLGAPFVEAPVTLPLSPASILLRGSSLRNTESAIGVVVFAGHETKVMKNATLPPSKRSRIEKDMDVLIFFMFGLLAAMCIIGAITFAIWTKRLSVNMWYLRPDTTKPEFDPKSPTRVAIYSFVTSFVLYGYLIPISLYVSMEMVKVFQSMVFIGRDRDMYHEETDTPAQARTSNLNEELGMVNTILSDKTGTLTRNVMEFFKCSIAGVSYGNGITEIEKANARRLGTTLHVLEDPDAAQWKQGAFNFYDKRLMGGAWQQEDNPDMIRQFFRCLSFCHTVIPDGPDDPATIRYQAESPDESALVAAAKVFGFFFYKRNNTHVFVRETADGVVTELQYEILNILEFDSTRKRMSVICRTPEGKILLYCKGADTVIYERLASKNKINDHLKGITRDHMEEYGSAGLRTLCLAFAEIDHDEYDVWQEKYFEAKTALHDRDEKLAAVSELIERQLVLLGCTAIEDKLQKGVPECIERLANAGIRIWVLTGDKQETAINIGFACSLLRGDMTQYIISANLPEILALEDDGRMEEAYALAHVKVVEQLDDVIKCIESQKEEEGHTDNALIIDGKALLHGLADDVKDRLLRVGAECAAVICCRVSPKQKALVTRLVKSRGDTTLGIGDGANDVGMIQEAHIGVGISGQEGMQAVMSSDFSIAQFRFLETLLLIHGRWSYLRITKMVGYFFYKNLLFGLTIFFYNALCFYSGQILYNDFYMSLFNVVFTVLPPLVLGTMEQDVNKEMSRKYPGLYQVGPRNMYFSHRARAAWLLNGFWQAGILFVMVIYATPAIYADRSSGSVWSHWEVGSTMFTVVVITVHLELASILEHWTWLHHLSIWGGMAVWFLYLLAYGSFPLDWSQGIYHILTDVLATAASYWLLLLVPPIACILPGFLIRQVCSHIWPDDKRIVMEIERMVETGEIARPKSMHANAGPLSTAYMTPRLNGSMGKLRSQNSGFVPMDAPGATSYFTPKHAMDHTRDVFRCNHRNPVIAGLDDEMRRNPFRHRTPATPLQQAVKFLKIRNLAPGGNELELQRSAGSIGSMALDTGSPKGAHHGPRKLWGSGKTSGPPSPSGGSFTSKDNPLSPERSRFSINASTPASPPSLTHQRASPSEANRLQPDSPQSPLAAASLNLPPVRTSLPGELHSVRFAPAASTVAGSRAEPAGAGVSANVTVRSRSYTARAVDLVEASQLVPSDTPEGRNMRN
ncbi:hypothetical protein WJX72_004020 [[Myrmecia] bisecta]|uniref:Phospholipid-transporting ATPase n=1 Tax=[Myrmecia] bisecta TaxID=41462 RepID=A0AAW1R567_9CHLO